MSHHLYKTEGIVLGGFGIGESNKILYLFTKELGLIYASAQSLRSDKSKLKYGLQDFSYSDISLVKGKSHWKITNTLSIKNLYSVFKNDSRKVEVCANIFSLLKKFITGEEENKELFNIVLSAFDFLEKEELTTEEINNFECILVLNIMHNLGYVSYYDDFKKYINPVWSKELLSHMNGSRTKAVREINKAINASQLG